MPLSLAEYADSLDERDLIWPSVPAPTPVRAVPKLKPLPGIRAVLWDVYGTILRTSDGGFSLFPNDEVRLQIALDKTIHEFHMWHSMYRKPGPPWKSMINQYRDYAQRLSMMAPERRGDFTDVDLVDVWEGIVDRLYDKDYSYDAGIYGDVRQLCQKIAYFFHCNLQALEARCGAVQVMTDLAALEIQQGLLADGQSFTMVQLLRALGAQGTLPPLPTVFCPETILFSHQLGVKKPSKSLFSTACEELRSIGIAPEETLHVSCRLTTDLVPAKAAGMKTALLAAEKNGLEAPVEMLKDSATRPDRLVTDLTQISDIVGGR
ncbi:MAG: HAD family hydrolase [Planctomycetaceae bacterium]